MAQDASGAPGRAGLGALFDAQAVAVLGASDDPTKFSGRPYQLLRRGGFAGRVYAVNPTRDVVQGDPAWPDLASLPEVPDLAVIGVPAARLADAVRDCAEAGVKAAVIFAGGLAETGDEGRALEVRLAAIARASGLRLLGPNCMGAMNLRRRLFASFSNAAEDAAPDPGEGGIGVVSQSGALGNFMLTRAMDAGIPVETWITTGNEADIEFAEALDALLDDPRIRGVVAYLEGARDGARLRRTLERAQASGVPVAILKVGATEEGGRAVRSHTDALVGDDAVYDALFRRTGTVRVHTVEDLLEMGRVFSTGARARVRAGGRRLLLASISGGVGVIMAEAAVRAGLT
ncbi:MAG: CoA-binding protein, partial [Pseudomonadota bacterium]|nr:CoA-binding protein [Pseudomonadota bacterium]